MINCLTLDKSITCSINNLHTIDYILVEMSFKKLYKDQGLFDELYTFLKKYGFEFRGPVAQLDHPKTKEVLQIDGLFVKSDSANIF